MLERCERRAAVAVTLEVHGQPGVERLVTTLDSLPASSRSRRRSSERTATEGPGQRSIGQPAAAHVPTPPSTTWMTCSRARALEQARRDRAALAGRADRRHRPGRVEAGGHRVEVVVGHVDRARDVAARPTRCARARRGSGRRAVCGPALVELGHRHALDRRDGAALLAPARHPAREEAGDVRDADRLRRARRRRARRRRRGRRSTTLLVAVGEPRELASRSPPRSAVMQTAPGMWASSNCSSVRTSTTSAPSCAAARAGAA